ncbi:hypothetical protein [Chryseobacterium sp. ISL-6]|uniref:hypothetical protein n=1 Tax=Chryseobacterium sp. ISL-6 TaxID=2819143 RepID=UPI001BEBCA56|nr:hypothetical protein [Chryseobacterium sp. ISL-6]MBT2621260.1 hypothetical protein [Chryseobacterium sp. ISL-6]
MKELISSLTVILLIISTQSCRGEDITDEPFYQKTNRKIGTTLNSKKMDSITIIKSAEQEIPPADGENEPPPKDGIRWRVKQ